jgi:NTP pyrophosphatase (non-canonical NTP hydrolase)
VTFDEYSAKAYEFAIYDDTYYPVLALAEEVGEVSKLFAKELRDGVTVDPDILTKELGDILWQLNAIAMDNAIALNDVAEINLYKLRDRAARNVIQGNGDNR